MAVEGGRGGELPSREEGRGLEGGVTLTGESEEARGTEQRATERSQQAGAQHAGRRCTGPGSSRADCRTLTPPRRE